MILVHQNLIHASKRYTYGNYYKLILTCLQIYSFWEEKKNGEIYLHKFLAMN